MFQCAPVTSYLLIPTWVDNKKFWIPMKTCFGRVKNQLLHGQQRSNKVNAIHHRVRAVRLGKSGRKTTVDH